MRRKTGELVPLEQSIIKAAIRLKTQGIDEFHGFQIAREIKDLKGAKLLTGFGTLYRALGRLWKMGYLERRWEEFTPIEINRPRRRYYKLIKLPGRREGMSKE